MKNIILYVGTLALASNLLAADPNKVRVVADYAAKYGYLDQHYTHQNSAHRYVFKFPRKDSDIPIEVTITRVIANGIESLVVTHKSFNYEKKSWDIVVMTDKASENSGLDGTIDHAISSIQDVTGRVSSANVDLNNPNLRDSVQKNLYDTIINHVYNQIGIKKNNKN